MKRQLFVLLAVAPLSATVIVQKNGDVITGKIVGEKTDRYVFRSPYGTLQIRKNNVAKLILDETTIGLSTIQVENKPVQARLVASQNNTQIYVTEDGRTIRQAAPDSGVSEEKKAETPYAMNHWLIAVAGSYGYSTFPQIDTAPLSGASSGMPPLEQGFHNGTWGGGITVERALSGTWGLGLLAMWQTWTNSASVSAQPGQISYDSTVRNNTIFIAPTLAFSLFGNLGRQGGQDLRLEIEPGLALNAAHMDLTLHSQNANYPTAATATGKNAAFAVEARLSYLFSLTDNLRGKVSIAYLRVFQKNYYDLGLTGNTAFPANDPFRSDFEAILKKDADPLQVISAQVGLEYGFW